MKNVKLIFFLTLMTQSLVSQEQPFYENYSWEENPEFNINLEAKDDIIALKDKVLTEFYFQEDGLVEYFLEHRVLWLNSDEKIEEFNKVYLPYTATSELKVNRARVITNSGKIIELDDSKILTAQNEETGRNYKFFAFEGVEKGSIIEYYYVVKRYPRYKGNRVTFQSSYNKHNVEFDVYAPTNLIFKFKTYNNSSKVVLDTLATNKKHWTLRINELQDLQDEEVSAYHASKAFVVYKLDKNTANNSKDLSSYGKVAQNIYNYYYPELSKKNKNNIKSFIKEAIPTSELNEEATVRKLEFYIKNNFVLSNDGSDNLKDLNEVISKKIANETGILKLYTNVLKTLNIKHEIVLTSNRQNLKFDKDFEANNFLTDFLIYFPKTKQYFSPTDEESRFGFPPAYLMDNYGLFIKAVSVGEFSSGVGKVKYIKPLKASKSTDQMIIDINFENDNLSNCNINLDRAMSGYYAMYFQPFTHLADEEDINDLVEGFAKNLNENITINHQELINGDPELFGVKPIQVVVNFDSEAFVEKAGNKYLFKVGELIGQQIQMYQEKKRILPVESEFNRSYIRTINLKVPEGYKIANLNDINIDNHYTEDDEKILSFKSSYELKENLLIITADEHYRKNILDTSIYEEYRKVINSAADFNKITLVLEPI